MKVILKRAACSVFFLAALLVSLPAEINKAHRYFEIGADVNAGVSNSWFGLADILQETIVVDFVKMSDKLSRGLELDARLNGAAFFNLDVGPGKKTHIGFSVGVTGSAHTALPQGIIDFLAKGNVVGKEIAADLDVHAEAYLDASVEVGFFVRKLGVSIKPSVFVPLVYGRADDYSRFTAISNPDGSIKVEGRAGLAVHSAMPLDGAGDTAWLNRITENLGFDLSLDAEYAVLPFLDLGINIRNIPFLTGKMDYVMRQEMKADYHGSLSGFASSGGSFLEGDGFTMGDPEYGQDRLAVRRPLKAGFAAAIRPVNNAEWFTIYPSVDFGFRLNGENDFFFVDYDLTLRFKTPYNIFAFSVSTSRIDEIFSQSFGIMLNLRVLQLDVGLASQSASFVRSWKMAGLGARVGVRIGF